MNLPKAFSESMCHLLGQEAYERLECGLADEPQVSVRLNVHKLETAGFYSDSKNVSLQTSEVPWCRSGFYLADRPAFTFDPLFHAGAYYVQEAGSMFLEQAFDVCMRVLNSDRPLTALDLCAAPGGKSTHLRSLLPEGSFLVSNEPVRQRAQVLAENMQKWGYAHCMVTNAYPADFSPLINMFDLIVADVPCSGEGMFRKDEGAIAEWSPENVTLCCERQRNIIADIWPTLKPGGCLIYSTCTFNQHEDEENVAWIAQELGAEILEIPLEKTWNILGDLTGQGLPVYHFLPGWTRGEGFFIAVLRKEGALDECEEEWNTILSRKQNKRNKAEKRKDSKGKNSVSCNSELKDWLLPNYDWDWIQEGDRLIACPVVYSHLCAVIQSCLPVVYYGIPVAELKGRDWIPTQALALNEAYRTGVFPEVALDYLQAVAYLRKEALVLPEGTPKGYVLLTYRGFALGFAKQIGNRANNLYPEAWRIRSGYVTRCELL